MTTKALEEVLEKFGRPLTDPHCATLVASARAELTALSSVPEDVARDHDAVESDLRTEGYTDTSNAMQALSRLATAAARVPGLEAELKQKEGERLARIEERNIAESERDAARQEATTANEQLQAVHRQMAEVAQVLDAEVVPDGWGAHAAAQKRMAEHRALTARVAELERQVMAETMAKGAAIRQGRESEARATAAEAKVQTLEERVRELHGDFIMNGPAAPTPAPGLRDAVGHAVARWRDLIRQGVIVREGVRIADIVAAYDAAKGGCGPCSDGECSTHPHNDHGDAAKGGEVPEVLPKVVVAQALRKAGHRHHQAYGATQGAIGSLALDDVWNALGLDSVASELPAAPDASLPTGPGGGEPAPEDQCGDCGRHVDEHRDGGKAESCEARNDLEPTPRARIAPTPTSEVPALARGIHDDRTCGACNGPLETSRDAVCEACAPESTAHAIAESMAPTLADGECAGLLCRRGEHHFPDGDETCQCGGAWRAGLPESATPEVPALSGKDVPTGTLVAVSPSFVKVVNQRREGGSLYSPPEPAAPEVVWEGAGVAVNADGSYSQRPGFHPHEVVDTLARALAEAKREADWARQNTRDVDRDRCNTINDLTRRTMEERTDAARKAAEDMRERAATWLEHKARAHVFDGVLRRILEVYAKDIRSLPLEDK